MKAAPLLEICVASPASALAAAEGGADRLELCSALELGGLTPSPGLYKWLRKQCTLPLAVLIRPRPGDFVYDEAEMAVMLRDIAWFCEAGADAIVCGALRPDGHIAEAQLFRMLEAARGRDFVFHRAFDRCAEPEKALELLCAAGVRRILSSGQAPSAPEGAGKIAAWQLQAAGRIELMPGAGIRPGNLAALHTQLQAPAYHASARSSRRSAMASPASEVRMGEADGPDWAETDAETVRALKAELHTAAG